MNRDFESDQVGRAFRPQQDVLIVGGGPGGLYAATLLARRGATVTVFEEHQTAGDPVHCTGVLATEAFDEFDLPRDSVLNALTTARFFGPAGASIEYSTRQVEAVAVDRLVFDGRLYAEARAAGARIEVGSRICDIQISDRVVTATDSTGAEIRARACILACGANYTFQRRLGLGIPAMYLQSAQIELLVGSPGDVELHFGAAVAPRGFAWVVPVRRADRWFARIGLMCERDAREYFDRFLADVGPRWRVDDSDSQGPASPRSKILPLGPIQRTYASRVLAIGDAAGLVKATTGGGIYYSLVSGRLAADVLADALEKDDLSHRALSRYERRWQALLGDELSAQQTLRAIADRLSDDDIDELFELARIDGIMPIVKRTATFNRHRHLIMSLLAHDPARRILMRRVLGWTA